VSPAFAALLTASREVAAVHGAQDLHDALRLLLDSLVDQRNNDKENDDATT
jgi:hypothetical protein